MNYDSPREIREFLKDQDIALKKKWGQNFLVSQSVRRTIISRLAPLASDFIWEIGPGLGAMTEPILESKARILAFEIDRGMIRSLEILFGARENFTICEGDFVKTFKKELEDRGTPDKIVGNLPYSSASKIILVLIDRKIKPKTMIFTLQRELAQRIASLPSKKSYSSFSVICQYAFEIEKLEDVPPHAFFPQPDVVSSIVALTPRTHSPAPVDEDFFYALCRASFSSKRKTLYNNIIASSLIRSASKESILSVFDELGINRDARAEELDVGTFVSLSNALSEFYSGSGPLVLNL